MSGVSDEPSERGGSRGSSVARAGGGEVEVWGVLNVTPDSFSDGGAHFERDAAVAHGLRMSREGASVIDVGGASSRPRGRTYGEGAAKIDVEEELRRTIPVIEALARADEGLTISVDTTEAEVAEAALAAGARIVNDVSMGRSEALLDVCAAHGAELVLMHTRADGRIDEETTRYGDVVQDVEDELRRAVDRALGRGVLEGRIWIDPGLGFAKSAEQSMALLRATPRLASLGWPLLVGASRKSFLGVFAAPPGAPTPSPTERLGASLAAASLAALLGARGVRVHDVRESAQAVRIGRRARGRASEPSAVSLGIGPAEAR